jgi:alkanesulfonate monooxygenase SsuD/methylene tetrahydromethanopterin reductase-like flavin-dependent oxidoreductase (luciferase family)
MGAGSSSSEAFIRESGRIRQLLEELNRDAASFHFSKRVYLAVDNDEARGERRIRDWFGKRYKNADLGTKVSIWGSAANCTEKIQEIVKAGAERIVLNPMFDEIEHLEICAKEIMPRLT